MYARILKQIREKVRARRYVMTLHAEEEMDHDELTVFDIEHGLLTGEVIERQKDRDTSEWKYLVKGHTLEGEPIVVVSKLGPGGALVVITVFLP